MKILLLILLCSTIALIDQCKEYRTYQQCIQSNEVYCYWDYLFEICSESDNYLIGCSVYINRIGCIKQLGYGTTQIALCKFEQQCQDIDNLNTQMCNNNLNKYGCLSIRSQQICKWDNQICQQVTGNDIDRIQSTFHQIYYSVSACQYIKNYLIIHHTLLWKLIEYQPNLLQESNEQILNQINENYQDLNLSNSYGSNKFIWFDSEYKYNIINRIRLGCNAIDIKDQDDFKQIITSQYDTYGVNHVYCKYLERIESYIIYQNGRCIQINPQILAYTDYIDQNNIQCNNLSYRLCSTYNSKYNKCYISQNLDIEYSCLDGEQQIYENQQCYDQISYQPQYQCNKFDYCYFDINNQQCSQFCYNLKQKDNCINTNVCNWLGKSNIEQNDFIFCVPIQECNQLGLDKQYCKYMHNECDWQDNKCIKLNNSQTLQCQQAFNKYVCLNIIKSDQLCLWYNEECINFIDYNNQYLYNTLPFNYLMNRNLCIQFKNDLFLYDSINYKCIYQNQLQINCNNYNINKYHCFNIINDLCIWDDYNNQCKQIDEIGYCNNLINVSYKVCNKAKLQNINNICQYNWDNNSCYENQQQINLIQIEQDCYQINQQYQYRQWKLGKCIELTVQHINQIQCISWRNVNRNVCVINIFNNQPCIYDEQQKLCYNDIIIYDCSINYNKFACQQSLNKCYYDEINDICKDIDNQILQQLHCDTNYISKSTCLSIETFQIKCMWDQYTQECRINDQPFQYCNQFYMNKYSCITQKALITQQYNQYHYCQFDQTKLLCNINNDNIIGCGTQLNINYHRCIYYTSNLCMFQNNQCIEIASTQQSRLELQYLYEMNCELANIQLCSQIINPSQGCRYYKFIQFDYIDAKCINIEFNKFTCTQLASITTPYINQNKMVCNRATDSCIYSSSTSTCAKASTISYLCSFTGISQTACLLYTYGKCIFYQDYCQYQTDNNISSCTLRNQQACISSNLIKCVYNISLKQCITINQDCSIRIDSQYQYSWSTCSTSQQNCYGYKNKCIIGMIDHIPCDLPGLSYSVCKSQSNLYCEYMNGYCQYQINRLCNEIIDKEECLNNKLKDQYCVYHNNSCFNVIDNSIWNCQSFDYTSYHYCKRFTQCDYDFNTHLCYFKTQQQQYINCLDNNDQNQLFKLNENNECIQINEIEIYTCIEIQNIKVNYNLCQHISNLDNNNCQYDTLNHLCKLTYLQQPQNCESILNELQCMFTIITCYVNYTNSIFTTCTTLSIDINSKLNRYGCNAKIDKSYIFNYDDWNCTQSVTSSVDNLRLVNFAHQLNENGCYEFGSAYGISLFTQWKNNKCIRLTEKQAMNLSTCKGLNKNACTSPSKTLCFWDKINLICQADTTREYNVNCESQIITNINYTYSQALCSKINIVGQRCIQKASLQGCEQLNTTDSKSIVKCILLGLNKEACFLETKQAYCFWNNGSCDDANLLLQKCEDDVSQRTCANIKNYLCQWKNDKCITFQPDYTLCENQSGYQQFCLNNLILQCKYLPKISQCINFTYTPMTCDNFQSKFACKNVINQTCQWIDNQCQILINITECSQIYNRESCLLNKDISCIWDDNQGCQSFQLQFQQNYYKLPSTLNQKGCLTYSIEETNYKDFKCTNILSYDQIKDKININLGQLIKNECQNQLIKLDCILIHTQNQFCIWLDNKCQIVQQIDFNKLICLSDINIWTCLSITTQNQNCKWSSQKCMNYRDDDTIKINVNVNVCINYTENHIYENHSCVYSNDIPCNSQGISKLTCLNNQNYACQYDGYNCINFQNNYKECNQIMQVSKKACSLVGNQLKCQYSTNYSCTQFIDLNLLDGISKKACLTKNGYYYWKNDLCQELDFIPVCNEGQEVTSDSCSLIDGSLCLYSSIKGSCVSEHNQYLLTCSTPGMNRNGCFAVLNEPCIFKDNKCQQYQNQYESYVILNNVNELVCRRLIYGDIEYNEIEHKCTVQLTKTKCNGLNINACKQINYCKWDQDLFLCSCSSSSTNCYTFNNKQDCLVNKQCMYNNSECYLKQCKHLSIEECQGQQYNQYCYINQYNKCSQTYKCEDIIDSKNCESIYINDHSCIQKKNTSQCISYDNYDLICSQSIECTNNNCIYENNKCRVRICQDIIKSESCNQTYNCAYIDQQCQSITSCFQIKNSSICNQVKVNNLKCNWQQQNLIDKNEICTSNPCQLLSPSKLLCHGNEVNNYSCILRNVKCVQCEFIQEQCECNSYQNICQFQNSKCTSILCSDYLTKDECKISKCEWSTQLNKCNLKCQYKFNLEQCEQRQNECNWNSFLKICQTGPQILATQYKFQENEIKYIENQNIIMIFIIILIY